MKLYSKQFDSANELTSWVNNECIDRIESIVHDATWQTLILFYWR